MKRLLSHSLKQRPGMRVSKRLPAFITTKYKIFKTVSKRLFDVLQETQNFENCT